MNRFLKLGVGIAIICLAIMVFFNRKSSGPYNDAVVSLTGRSVSVEVADTPETRLQGLSGRTALTDDQGMWFVFDEARQHNFWMKDMNFPIDIIWITSGEVVDISYDAAPEPGKPDSQLTRYAPTTPVDRVLEVPGGWAKRHNLKIGERVKFRDTR